ncbi:SLC13 family permease [Oceanobacillus sp. FSL W7-1293]|uniref:SLC13 family permease n=1 Tax=Oceanobacillus sp. FSL W7-1293 TaxID=2921699 RepID=UPI0030D1BC6E
MSPAIITLLILLLATILFLTGVIPVALTALLATMLLYLTGIIDAETVFSGLTNNVVLLISGMFIIGAALFETGVARRMGNLITRFAKTEKQLLFAVMVIGAGLSAFLSNTSTTAVMMPIVIAIAASSGFSSSKLLMPLAYATALGGMITLVGTNGNLAVQSVMENENTPVFGFFEFAYIGIPLTIIGIIYMMTIGYKLIPNRETALEETDTKNEEETKSEETTWKQMVAIGVLLAAVVFMIFEEQFGIPLHIVSVMGAMVIVLTRTMSEKKAYRSLDFSTIILVAAMMPMATALAETGAAQMIADYVLEMAGSNAGPYVITALIFGVTTVLTSVMSNTAAAALMAPIGLVIATSMGVDPKAILMTVCVGASAAYASPVGTPPNTMIYGPGNYTFLDYIKCGFPFLVIQLIVCVVIVPLIWPF